MHVCWLHMQPYVASSYTHITTPTPSLPPICAALEMQNAATVLSRYGAIPTRTYGADP